MCRGLTFTLFVRFFDKYYVTTIPKSRIEILFSFLVRIGITPCIIGRANTELEHAS